MRKFIPLVFLFLLISNSFGKSNKNKDDQSPEIIKINSNDQLPLFYEIIISGHFSNDKTGLTVSYLGDKIHNFVFIKGEVLNISEPSNLPTVSINPDQLNDEEFEVSENSDFSTQSPTLTPTSSQTVPPTPTPTSSQTDPPTPTPTSSQTVPPTPTPTSSKMVPPTETPTSSQTVPPTETPTPSQTVPPTETPTETPTPSQTIPPTTTPSKPTLTPKPTKSSKPTKTPTPTMTPSSNKGYDLIKFNITDISDIDVGKITISYKNGQSSSKHFEPNSIIKTMDRANSVGGIVEFKGSFFYTDDYEPIIRIGNKTCETLTSSQTSIRCYLSSGTGCGYHIFIDNLLNPIYNNGNSLLNATYCYANPIIDKVFGYKDKKDTTITIIGKNFLNNATVIIEKSNGHKRNCSNIILSTDTLFICQLSNSYDKNLNSTKSMNSTILSFINNSPNSTGSNEIIEMISGYFQIKISTKPSTNNGNNNGNNNSGDIGGGGGDDDDGEFGSVEKSVVDGSNSNKNNNQGSSKKLYLLIILPTVLFIIVAVLVAVFIKTRVVQNSGSTINKKDTINVPFQMLDEMTT
ncbi:hypothetical protein ACTA71_007470 [Dictyostelium dimigraforme]